MTPAELDVIASGCEREWGIGRLPLLVSEQTAARFQAALDLLASDWPPAGQTWEAVRASIARGWAALDGEARKRGHEPLPGPVAEAEWEPGKVLAVALDNHHRQALDLRAKAEGRQHYSVWTVAELAVLVRSIPIVSSIKDMFPGAEILPPRLPPVGKVPRDEIPFGAWGAGDPPAGLEARQ
jgi:hypothetical protein